MTDDLVGRSDDYYAFLNVSKNVNNFNDFD